MFKSSHLAGKSVFILQSQPMALLYLMGLFMLVCAGESWGQAPSSSPTYGFLPFNERGDRLQDLGTVEAGRLYTITFRLVSTTNSLTFSDGDRVEAIFDILNEADSDTGKLAIESISPTTAQGTTALFRSSNNWEVVVSLRVARDATPLANPVQIAPVQPITVTGTVNALGVDLIPGAVPVQVTQIERYLELTINTAQGDYPPGYYVVQSGQPLAIELSLSENAAKLNNLETLSFDLSLKNAFVKSDVPSTSVLLMPTTVMFSANDESVNLTITVEKDALDIQHLILAIQNIQIGPSGSLLGTLPLTNIRVDHPDSTYETNHYIADITALSARTFEEESLVQLTPRALIHAFETTTSPTERTTYVLIPGTGAKTRVNLRDATSPNFDESYLQVEDYLRVCKDEEEFMNLTCPLISERPTVELDSFTSVLRWVRITNNQLVVVIKRVNVYVAPPIGFDATILSYEPSPLGVRVDLPVSVSISSGETAGRIRFLFEYSPRDLNMLNEGSPTLASDGSDRVEGIYITAHSNKIDVRLADVNGISFGGGFDPTQSAGGLSTRLNVLEDKELYTLGNTQLTLYAQTPSPDGEIRWTVNGSSDLPPNTFDGMTRLDLRATYSPGNHSARRFSVSVWRYRSNTTDHASGEFVNLTGGEENIRLPSSSRVIPIVLDANHAESGAYIARRTSDNNLGFGTVSTQLASAADFFEPGDFLEVRVAWSNSSETAVDSRLRLIGVDANAQSISADGDDDCYLRANKADPGNAKCRIELRTSGTTLGLGAYTYTQRLFTLSRPLLALGDSFGLPALPGGIAVADVRTGVFDFTVATDHPGDVAVVLIELFEAAGEGLQLYKYSEDDGWVSFITMDYDQAFSAQPPCPSPSARRQADNGEFDPTTDVWRSVSGGIQEGDKCLLLQIQDGGENDADGTENGIIFDPNGLGRKAGKRSGGSGAIDIIYLILWVFGMLIMRLSSRRKVHSY